MPFSRRALLAGLANCLTLPALAATRHHKPAPKPASRPKVASTEVPKLTGTPLPIPPLLEVKAGTLLELKASTATHAFLPDKPQDVTAYNGSYPGPTIRLSRGATTAVHLVNGLARATNLHWHGAVVDPTSDATLIQIPAGDTWETQLTIDQPAATLWYHEHMLASPRPDRPCGMLIIDDGSAATLDLPATYGVDDFPLILDDRTFDADGKPQDQPGPDAALIGSRGATILVNGVANALLKVPQRLVRLRILNAARARIFRLFMDDERSFHLIAGDGGYLAKPLEIDTLIVAPGERAEIIVNFADGSTSLLSTPDDVAVRGGASGDQVTRHTDSFAKQFRVLGFDAVKDTAAQKPLPADLPAPVAPEIPDDVTHRRFEVAIRAVGADLAGTIATINGKTFDRTRIDVTAKRATTEIWQLVAADMAHTLHVAGAQFHVLTQDGDMPRAWNRCAKDTVYVENTIEVQVTFPLPAAPGAPFLLESSLPEHAAQGAAAIVTIG